MKKAAIALIIFADRSDRSIKTKIEIPDYFSRSER
jgi:hypothetical protein